ncbi:MAG: DUF3050 domain-containing protein [Bacteroidota bacterium]|jgi:hypothetical protein
MSTHPSIINLQEKIEVARKSLLSHPVYQKIKNLEGLQQFSQHHVYAVWDFMSLLKSLQRDLTCVNIPWIPVGTADTRYLINEIVLGEESDVDELGNRISHFELYIKAMNQMGANTKPILALIDELKQGNSIGDVISSLEIHPKIKAFLTFTFEVALLTPAHVKAAVFTFGREDLIPDMFMSILNDVHREHPEKVSTFHYYIERHIEVDGDHHSHLALSMVEQLCGTDENKWKEAEEYAVKSLHYRAGLWDSILDV